MREILFRGKDTGTGKWLYSMEIAKQAYNNNEILTYYIGGGNKTIDGKTLGQYTGLSDKNGIKIFEGDIVLLRADDEPYTVGFDECCFQVYSDSICYNMDCFYDHDIEVIGNIYDSPELLGRAEK